MKLTDRVTTIDGLGTKAAKVLRERHGIRTVGDLLEHYPNRYQDLGSLMDLSSVSIGEPATLVGRVGSWEQRVVPKGRRRLKIATAPVLTESGGTFEITFFNQPWIPGKHPPGTLAAFSGKVERYRGRLKITQPQVNSIGRGHAAAGRAFDRIDHRELLPVYPGTADVPGYRIGGWIEQALEDLPTLSDHLDEDLLDREDLLARDDAVRSIHLPPDRETARAAQRRLVFDELLCLQVALQSRRARLEAELAGVANPPADDGHASRYLQSLPFSPTGAQLAAFSEIGADLAAEVPMHRLLQGDVGSGKTVVAIWSMLAAVDSGRQAALMVPTEVLAEQHARTLTEQLAPLGVNVLDGLRVSLLTGSTPTSSRRTILAELLGGQVDLVVGTHALLEEPVQFADLGVVVIDEQHRFGVSQRVQLKDKRRSSPDGRQSLPDVLVMTATPIPRSLALTVYGDLDVTVLDELPPGRQPVVTQLIGPEAATVRRPRLEQFVREQAAQGLQTYWVCPLVEESDEVEATSAIELHRHLAEEVFPELQVELVHGRLSSEDKEAAMGRFRSGDADVLVATTVIEVGVDVATATVMVIENAERFGISQLHQLRGRVGRGGGKSYCVLFSEASTDDADTRLQAVADSADGFELADVDLRVRGEGQLFGTRQSGMPDLRIARLRRDVAEIARTRTLAMRMVADDAVPPPLWEESLRRFGEWLDEDHQTG